MRTEQITPLAFHDFQPELEEFFRDVVRGLGKGQKEISAKYFYDERGSALFEQICDLEEYYPTRTEVGLLETYCSDMAAALGEQCVLIEYGSGSSRKVPILLAALHKPLAYMPIDICREFLLESSRRIAACRDDLDVVAICADYMLLTQLPHDHKYPDARKVIFFPGSTIGNCTPMEAIRLLKNAVKLVGRGGGMLIGVDLKKSPVILHAAYNDTYGVTAEFNLNILARINRELQADFELSNFRHQAFYNAERGRIEMHLLSCTAQTVTIGEYSFQLLENESIHTENSYKYSLQEFQGMADAAGFAAEQVWVDEKGLFSLHYLSVPR